MKDFTQIGNSQNEHFADNEAQKTLDTVFNEWQSGKQVVEWQVIPPSDPKELALREKIVKLNMYSSPILLVIGGIMVVMFAGLDKTLSAIVFGICVLLAVCEFIFLMPWALKMARQNVHNATTVKIDRNKKLAVITRQQQRKKVKYGSQGVLPAFRLPENDMGSKYATMRGQLQQQITAETGFLFEEVQ
ncbi:MAG: hypothetical protein IKZ88_04620 [Neisseriaceae bacterium]|nr:hypothetical protein [Neisseriaceae bacterium]